jgi:predicted DNA-binding transcriptional regulator YafY
VDRTERFHHIDRILRTRRAASMNDLLTELEVSRATFKRDLEYLRDRMGAPIVWDTELRAYRYQEQTAERAFALPNLWFSAGEILALLSAEHLIEALEPGVLAGILGPFRQRLAGLISSSDTSVEEIKKRVLLLPMATRPVIPPHFALIAEAVLRRKRLMAQYRSRSEDALTERMLSPQRLVHYRDNWYLDAWCHLRRGLRTFALDRIQSTSLLDAKAKPVTEARLNKALASGYGIFSGAVQSRARLRFSAERARWVAHEIWHPHQRGRFDKEGRYVLEFPYSDARELIMDILRHGAEVEVLAPQKLRDAVHAELIRAQQCYSNGG